MRSTDILLTLACVFLIGCGQILFKLAAREVAVDGLTLRSVTSWLSPPMLAALVIYAVATLLWVWVLKSASLSLAYPLYALAFVLVPLLGWLLFGEPMPRAPKGQPTGGGGAPRRRLSTIHAEPT